MKIGILATLGLMACAVAFHSCKKSGTAFSNATMKPWFDRNCSSCHGKGGPNKGNWYYDPNNYESSIKGNISDIYRQVYTNRAMPPTGVSSTDLSTFKTWYDGGYPAN